MKILMISEKDAANVSLALIVDSFLCKGHEVIIYAPYFNENVLDMFSPSVLRYPFHNLDDTAIEWCDIIFASALSAVFFNTSILHAHKPIFTQNYLTHSQVVWGGDLCFVSSLPVTESVYYSMLKYPRMGIGEPKYDRRTRQYTDTKKILFLDSGHYPFGIKGKQDLAKTLLDICKRFPDYQLIVKPRFLPGDAVVTHRNSLHLYDVIYEEAHGVLPSNLLLLTEHRNLVELIDASHTVICMYTSAFVGACIAGKGLVILDGLPSEDVYDVRKKHFQRTRSVMEGASALVNYSDAYRLLPDGILCSDEYLEFLLPERENVAEKIVGICEQLYEDYYCQEYFPKITNCNYQHYSISITKDLSMNWEKYISIRYENCLLRTMLAMIDFHINANIDVHLLQQYVESLKVNGVIHEAVFRWAIRRVGDIRDTCIIENADTLLQDDIDAGILLSAYFRKKKHEAIQNFPLRHLGAFYLFQGFVQHRLGKVKEKIEMLEKYVEISRNRVYIQEISDTAENRLRAFFLLITALMQQHATQKAMQYLKEMEDAYIFFYPIHGEKEKIMDRIHGINHTYLQYLRARLLHKGKNKLALPMKSRLMIYGAGMISREILLQDATLKSCIIAFVDQEVAGKTLSGIPVIALNDIKKYAHVRTIAIAVPHQYDRIREDIQKVRNGIDIIPVQELF